MITKRKRKKFKQSSLFSPIPILYFVGTVVSYWSTILLIIFLIHLLKVLCVLKWCLLIEPNFILTPIHHLLIHFLKASCVLNWCLLIEPNFILTPIHHLLPLLVLGMGSSFSTESRFIWSSFSFQDYIKS